jgi:multiple sugar transport system substrate-binding protein
MKLYKSPSNILLLCIILIMTLSLAACGKKDDEDRGPGPPLPTATTDQPKTTTKTTITFACSRWRTSYYKELAASFQRSNPDVRVKIVSYVDILRDSSEYVVLNDDTISQLVGAADVLELDSLKPSIIQRYALDLSPFINQDSTFEAEDFYPHTLEDLQWNGGVWAVPSLINFYLLAYDKDLFDQANVPYPEPGWTWDDFLSKAQALTRREGNQVLNWGFVESYPSFLPYIWGRAGDLVDYATTPPTPLLDSPQVAQAVRWYVELDSKHHVMPHLESVAGDVLGTERQLIKHGQVAMWGEDTEVWGVVKGRRNLGLAPFPVSDPQSQSSQLLLEGYIISAGTPHPDASWRWLNFLSRQKLGFANRAIPARRSSAERFGHWDALGEDMAAVYRFALAHGFSDVRGEPIQDTLFWSIFFIIQNNKDIEATLAGTQTSVKFKLNDLYQEQLQTTPIPIVPRPVEASFAQADTVIVFTPLNNSQVAVYRLLADMFNEAHSQVAVDVQTPVSGPGRLTTRAAEADCFAFYPYLASAEERGAVLSLAPFLSADPDVDLGDYDFVDEFRYAGQLWALPVEGFSKLIAYNQALFDAAGVAHPASDWTLDDFGDTAAALTQEQGQRYGFVSGLFETTDLMFFLEQHGATLLETRDDQVEFLFDASETQAALGWYSDLALVDQSRPVFLADWEARAAIGVLGQWEALIREGRAAMWTEYPGAGYVTSFENELAVGYVPLPRGPGRVGDYRVVGYYISAQTEHPQACWDWIKFLSERAEQITGLPARRSLAQSEGYRRKVGQDKVTALSRAFLAADRLTAFLDEYKPGWTSEQLRWLAQAYDAVLARELNVDAALTEAQHKADAYQNCLAAQDGFDDSAAWEACSAEVQATWGP